MADYQDILAFAKEHFVTVVPEFDMPGHAHAAIKAMEARYNRLKDVNITAADEYRLADPNDTTSYLSVQQWTDNAINPCIPSTYRFVRKVMQEVKDIHETVQPLQIFHFGGDEVASGVWTNSSQCIDFLNNNPEYKIPHGNNTFNHILYIFTCRITHRFVSKQCGVHIYQLLNKMSFHLDYSQVLTVPKQGT